MALSIPDWPGAEPGQFLMVSPGALGGDMRTDPLLPRPMAVFRQSPERERPGHSQVEILYKTEGRGTRLMADARTGDRFAVVGPLGRPFPSIGAGERAVLVGGGTGVASLFELAESADPAASVDVLLGARTADDLMGRDDYAALERVRVAIATEDGSLGAEGRVTTLLAPMLQGDSGLTVYACGPTPMMAACAKLAAEAGARCFVSLENNMACGFGVCLGCAAPLAVEPDAPPAYALVCRAGPVFEAAEVAWEAMP
jgi:dihydroorotate dehydrogenase electron transfer subunit